MKNNYPEIERLELFIKQNNISVTRLAQKSIDSQLTPVQLRFKKKLSTIYIADEYEDLELNNPILNCLLTLMELDAIDDSNDYLQWCDFLNLEANNHQLLSYYKDCVKLITDIKPYFPNNKIDCFISGLDFELNAGAAQYLRSQ